MENKPGTVKLGTAASSKPKHVAISAVITRGNGTVEDLGVVSETYYGFAKITNWINKIKQGLSKWI